MFGKEANVTVSWYVDERKVVASVVSAGELPRFARGPPKGCSVEGYGATARRSN